MAQSVDVGTSNNPTNHSSNNTIFPLKKDFPMDATIEEILKDYISFTKWANILVIGQPKSGKTSIIDSILSSQYKYVNADTVDEFKNDMMILSQYDLDFAIVTERVFQGFKESAAQNLQYFPLLKNDWNPAQIVGNGSRSNSESKYWKPRQKGRQKPASAQLCRARKEKAYVIYKRLLESEFTRQSLQNVNYAATRDYSLLFSGFIRDFHLHHDDMDIPFDIITLIEAFYVPNLLLIDSYKFQFRNQFGEKICCDLWESNGVHTKHWMDKTKRIQGVIFVVDLSSYNEYFVDEDGVKRNKLEYAHSVWTLWKQSGRKKLILLTKKDLFMEKVKTIPLSVCPLFAGLQGLDKLSACIGHIRSKFEQAGMRGRPCCVDTSKQVDIVTQFKILVQSL